MQHNIRQDCIPFHVVHTAAGHMHSSGPCWAAGEMLGGHFPAKWGHGRACTAPRWAFPSLIFSPVRMDKFISRRLFFLQRDQFLQHIFLSLGIIHLFPFSKPCRTCPPWARCHSSLQTLPNPAGPISCSDAQSGQVGKLEMEAIG